VRTNHQWRPTPAVLAFVLAAASLVVPASAFAADSPARTADGAPGLGTTAEDASGHVLVLGSGYARPHGSNAVQDVQQRLSRLGYGPGPTDGLFGPRTRRAVLRFQADHGLAIDGIVGDHTVAGLQTAIRHRAELLELGDGYGNAAGSGRVRNVQRSLTKLGYDAGPADGRFGPHTQAAVRRFQAIRGLGVDGIAGSQTLRRLSPSLQSSDASQSHRSSAKGSAGGGRGTPSGRPGETLSTPAAETDIEQSQAIMIIAVAILAGLIVGGVVVAVSRTASAGRRRREHRPTGDVPLAGPSRRPQPDGDGRAVAEPAPAPALWPFPARSGPRQERRVAATGRFARRGSGHGDEVMRDRSDPVASATAKRTAVRAPTLAAPSPMPGLGNGVRPDDDDRVMLVGARVDTASGNTHQGRSETIPVDLWLFAESRWRHWETGPLAQRGTSLAVGLNDIETRITSVVWPHRLDELAPKLRQAGIQIQTEELERLPFVVEVGRRLEREIAKRRAAM
jgi:peptidoglycan hydrolase-like protein with peptidoglycan-binding domain